MVHRQQQVEKDLRQQLKAAAEAGDKAKAKELQGQLTPRDFKPPEPR